MDSDDVIRAIRRAADNFARAMSEGGRQWRPPSLPPLTPKIHIRMPQPPEESSLLEELVEGHRREADEREIRREEHREATARANRKRKKPIDEKRALRMLVLRPESIARNDGAMLSRM